MKRAVTSPRVEPRVIAVAALVLIVIALGLIIPGGSTFDLTGHFTNASGLVVGDSVDVAGRAVGTVTSIGLTPDGDASVGLAITDSSILPLHLGTRAAIRALGQAGLANHYVALSPGLPSAGTLSNGAVLPTTQTSSLVNYDAVLDAFTPPQRASLKALIDHSAQVYAGSGAHYFNQMLSRLDPAFTQVNRLVGELANDRGAVSQVIRTGDIAASSIASRDADLRAAVVNTATSLHAIATERSALADSLQRAPAVLGQAQSTLAEVDTTVTALRPALKTVPAAAAPLSTFLQNVDATLPATVPVVSSVQALLPHLRASLTGLTPTARIAVPALSSAARALRVSRTVVQDFRYYSSDLILGVVYGLAGVAGGNYDEWGHYPRLEFTEPYQRAFGGTAAPLSQLLLTHPLAANVFSLRTRLFKRCPGGNAPPAPDGSSPWNPTNGLCDPSQNVPASVNVP
ncbi:MAG: MlaD family protein [Solirubrobacteraceae bacterium]